MTYTATIEFTVRGDSPEEAYIEADMQCDNLREHLGLDAKVTDVRGPEEE